MKAKRFVLLLLIASMAILSGCAGNSAYDKAVEAFKQGDFATATSLFAEAPEGHKDKALYEATLAAVAAYDAGQWLEAARLFEGLYRQAYDTYVKANKAGKKEITHAQAQGYRTDLVLPLYARFGITLEDRMAASGLYGQAKGYHPALSQEYVRDATKDDIMRSTISSMEGMYECLFYNSLYRYYEHQLSLGNDILTLAEYPFDYDVLPWYGSVIAKPWKEYYHNATAVEEAIAARGLADFYAAMDDSTSPVEVTASKLYINGANSFQRSNWYEGIQLAVPPFYLAATPEEIRYVFNVSHDTAGTVAGWYNRETGNKVASYDSLYTLVTLKDVTTGELLFVQEYTNAPKINYGNEAFTGSKTGQFKLTDEIREEILSAIGQVVPVDL